MHIELVGAQGGLELLDLWYFRLHAVLAVCQRFE